MTHLWILFSLQLLTVKICALGLFGVRLMAYYEDYITAVTTAIFHNVYFLSWNIRKQVE